MRYGLLLALGIVVWSGSAGAQGLQLAWLSCYGSPSSTSEVIFDCNPSDGHVYPLCGTFQLPQRAAGIVTLQGSVDFRFRTANIPPFWHLESDGCNGSGIVLSAARPAGCEAYQAGWCDETGAGCGIAVAYMPGFAGPARARLAITLSRPLAQPRDFEALPSKNFAFHLDFLMGNATTCTGCTSMARITWSELDLLAADGATRTILSSDIDSWPDAYVNDIPVPTAGTTWGRLKALYR